MKTVIRLLQCQQGRSLLSQVLTVVRLLRSLLFTRQLGYGEGRVERAAAGNKVRQDIIVHSGT